jgi:hypothetical protein
MYDVNIFYLSNYALARIFTIRAGGVSIALITCTPQCVSQWMYEAYQLNCYTTYVLKRDATQVCEVTPGYEASGGKVYETYSDIDKCRGDTTVSMRMDLGDLGARRRWEIDRQSRFADLVVPAEPGDHVAWPSSSAAFGRAAAHAATLWLDEWTYGGHHGLCPWWIVG